MLENKFHNLSDAAEVLAVKAELILRALAFLPALWERRNRWTVEDLAEIDNVIKTQIVPQLTRWRGVL